MNKKSLIALDIGTSSVRAVLFSLDRKEIFSKSKNLPISYPQLSWLEQDAEFIWLATLDCLQQTFNEAKKRDLNILGLGLTNQRETAIAWDSNSHRTLSPAIVWQCRRTAAYCESLKNKHKIIKEKTGLFCDPYFSATKFEWMLKNVKAVQNAYQKRTLKFGTVDTWIIWKLTQGKFFLTDPSNASRTMLYNIHTQSYDAELCRLFSIEPELLPEVQPSLSNFGHITLSDFPKTPIISVLGDQQASLFAHCAGDQSIVKNTYGTGLFMMAHTGLKVINSSNLISTVAWKIKNQTTYALEGSIFSGASALKWLKNQLGILKDELCLEDLISQIRSSEGLLFVPALTGLGAPFWASSARASFVNICSKHQQAHFCRSVLEALTFHSKAVFKEIKKEVPSQSFQSLSVDGGLSNINFLMEFQSSVLNMPVIRTSQTENTVQGILNFSGLYFDLWDTQALIQDQKKGYIFKANYNDKHLNATYDLWLKAVQQSIEFTNF